ncbi:MAG: zinc ribbon domain-containing protein [Lachnospiraceae bacterium]|nr:zinc ribbon domain-containing protein [Lachnospiraceae bacterium]
MFCEQCGAQVPDGMGFCDQCGAPVAGNTAQTAQSGPVNNVQPMQQEATGAYNKQKKSPLIPIVIAAVAVIIFGLGGFGIYKNIDKIKGLVAKVRNNEEPQETEPPFVEEPPEERPSEEVDQDEDKPESGGLDEDIQGNGSVDEIIPGNENTDEEKPGEGIYEEKPGKTGPAAKDDRPEIGDVWNYDTSKRPTWDEFEWVMSDEMTQGILNGEDMFSGRAYRLTDYDDVIGGWKGYLCYDPNNTYADNPWGGPVVFLVHAEISGEEDSPVIYFEWLQYRNTFDGDEGNLTTTGTFECKNSDNVINGKMENGWRINLEHFYWQSGQEYATGRMKAADGGDCILALFRP